MGGAESPDVNKCWRCLIRYRVANHRDVGTGQQTNAITSVRQGHQSSNAEFRNRRLKISNVDFPEPLLNALRGGRLVIFSGAGVSMGSPANLPNFRRLADQVATGTGLSIGADET